MKIKAYILAVLILTLPLALVTAKSSTESSKYDQYQVKAVFLYNFIKFTDWPEEKITQNSDSVKIGVIGKSPFGDHLELIAGKQAKGKKIAIKLFKSLKKWDKSETKDNFNALKRCHLLFICSSEKENLKEISNSIKNYYVLTVSDIDGFLETGGVIKFSVVDEKVYFEINIIAAKQAELKLRSKFLRLAKRVMKEEPPQNTKS
ncbi:MAG: YfiR family protein [Planctomycetes bacterium]|nr:YfiR family protein [Planctomycetota bacterium]